jgi:NADH:ubiquinone oxidoreductase subunit 4 (subunit M)
MREFTIGAPLLALAIVFGVYPRLVLDYMQPSVDKTVVELTEWTKLNRPTQPPGGAVAKLDATLER